MAQNWKKEAARRGYWYRKTKKSIHIQALEITTLKHLLLIHTNEKRFYFDLGKEQGMEEIRKEKDVVRNKYLDFVKKFNTANEENNTLKEVLDCAKKELHEVKQENEDIKEEYDDAIYMLDPMMCRINLLTEEITRLSEENTRLIEENSRLKESPYTSIAIKNISNPRTQPPSTEFEIHNLIKLKTEKTENMIRTPYLERTRKRKKRKKISIEPKRKKL